jgi:hypothetical protein
LKASAPKRWKKISLAVNNYFASLEAGAVEGTEGAEGEVAAQESAPESGEQAASEEAAESVASEATGTEEHQHEPEPSSAPETHE